MVDKFNFGNSFVGGLMRTLEQIEKEIAETKAELEDVHGTETEVYSRIVGYYRAVRNWNKGKQDEFEQRKMFSIESPEQISQNQTENDEKMNFPQKDEIPEEKNDYYEIYTRKTCPNCPPVKNYMGRTKLTGKSVDVDSDTGLAEAAEKGVFAAPTVIFYDKNGNETARGHNVEELEEIFSRIPLRA